MRQRPGYRNAFTLVELLVVIAIIGVLMALLLPAVQSARESGRRLTCTNNQYQMAFAAIRFNDTNNFLPGWRNSMVITSATIFPSWPVVVLPFVERMDIIRTWQTGSAAVASASNNPYISLFVCPSSPPDTMTTPVLAYAGNCGSGTNGLVGKADGVMVDATQASVNRNSLDDISSADGTAMTLLVSEKCGVSYTTQMSWNVVPPAAISWTATFPGYGLVGSPPQRIVNTSAVQAAPGTLSQPSSQHPGGAVAAFCDGRTIFLKDSLAARVYAQLITSNNAAASAFITGAATTQWNTGTYILNEGDYQ